MNLAAKFFSLFIKAGAITEEFENEEFYKYEICTSEILPAGKDQITKFLEGFSQRDTLRLNISLPDATPITLNLPAEMDDLLTQFNGLLKATAQTKITFRLEVDKKINGNTVSLYNSDAFCNYLRGRKVSERLNTFSKLIIGKEFIVFQLFDDSLEFNTPTFYFSRSIKTSTSQLKQTEREIFVSRSRELSHYGESNSLSLVPKDFQIKPPLNTGNKLQKIFSELCLITILIRLFDFTNSNGTELEYRLSGYTTLKGSSGDFTVPYDSLDQYMRIIEWVYNEGNFSDKVGLARNIISLNIHKLPNFEINENTYDSIQSAYEIYLKQNIKQYIDVRNKISEQLVDFNKRATQIIDTFGTGFQKSALAVLTFFASILVTKILSGGKLEDTFTYDAYYLTLVFWIISVGYLFLSLKEVDSQIDRFNINYTQVKTRYKDLLTEADIENILNKDAEHNADNAYLKDKRKLYLWLWIIVLSVILVFTSILHWLYVRDYYESIRYFFARPLCP